MHPFSALLWLPGLWLCLVRTDDHGVLRVFGAIFVVSLGVFLLTRGKPYYLAPAYPPLFAVGALACERWLTRAWRRAAFLARSLQVWDWRSSPCR